MNNFKIKKFIFWNFIAFALLGSWLIPQTRIFWDKLDSAFFFLVNGTLPWSVGWAKFWALANKRIVDIISLLAVGSFFAHIYFKTPALKRKEFACQLVAFGTFLGFFILLYHAIDTLFLEDFKRHSPSLVLTPAYRLSHMFPGIETKDASSVSFPGDHAFFLMAFTFFAFKITSRKTDRTIITALMILFSLPRLVSGAHWLTDNLIGAGFMVILALTWYYLTPLQKIFPGWIDKFFNFIKNLVWRKKG